MATQASSIPGVTGPLVRRLSRRVWLAFGLGFPIALLLLAEQPRWGSFAGVAVTLRVSGVLLLLWMLGLLWWQKRKRLALDVTFRPFAPHYVQAVVQISIYVYWGWYWRPIYDHAGLILAQLVLAYSLDMLLALTRRRSWALTFGPFPIILSTNLFLLFRPEWFFLQFAVVAVGILGKEFIRWNRDGRNTHIFNPSAFSLFVFSVVLIATDTTSWSFAEDIATKLNLPPYIYLQIFLVGLVVQYLFSVTLVTLMSALALIALNLAYTAATGTYFFIDSNIPIAVFLGLHLLITDPATSPRTAFGKALFGVLYGSGVFVLYWLLGLMGAPTFYDKLLCVPILNLLVPWIDALARRLKPTAPGQRLVYSEITPRANRIHMLIWIAVFSVMLSTSFVGRGHPGNDIAFWENACENDLRNGCRSLFTINRNDCHAGDALACIRAGEMAGSRPEIADRLEEGHLLSRGCDLRNPRACDLLRGYLQTGGKAVLDDACLRDDYPSCFVAGVADLFGFGASPDTAAGIESWRRACDGGWVSACARLGELYLAGNTVAADPETAAGYFERACALGNPPACMTLGLMHRRGHGAVRSEERAQRLLRSACDAGWEPACGELQ